MHGMYTIALELNQMWVRIEAFFKRLTVFNLDGISEIWKHCFCVQRTYLYSYRI